MHSVKFRNRSVGNRIANPQRAAAHFAILDERLFTRRQVQQHRHALPAKGTPEEVLLFTWPRIRLHQSNQERAPGCPLRLERLFEIVDQIAGGLEADGESNQALGKPHRLQLLGGEAAV